MSLEIVTDSIEGYVLEVDVFNSQGLLLLQKGHILTEKDINFLTTHNIFSVHATLPEKPVPELAEDKKGPPKQTTQQTETQNTYRFRIKQAEENYTSTIELTKELFEETRQQGQINVNALSTAFYPLYQLSKEQKNLFHSLISIQGIHRDVDTYLAEHSLHTALITVTMATLIGCSEKDCFDMGKAALVHDLGKIRLDPSLLQKASEGLLTEAERQEWQKHHRYGYEILRQSVGKNNLMLEGALYHHEHLNGAGYPSGMKGEKIPLVAQLIAAANMYDTLCSPLSPDERLTPYFACQELTIAAYKGQLSPKIVTAFVHFITAAYVGDQVLLSNGQHGKIIRTQAHEPHLPTIQLDSGEFLNLQQQRDLYIQAFVQLENSSS